MTPSTAAGKWSAYRDTGVVRRAEQYAKFTLPHLLVDPLQAHNNQQTVEHDFQSYGGLLVNNLASKLVSALFPAGRPSFRIQAADELVAAAEEQGVDEATLSGRMAELERKATEQLFKNAALAKLTRAIKLLIVSGTALLYRDTATSRFMVWSIQSFSTRRLPTGELAECVLKQHMQFNTLPEDIQEDARKLNPGTYKGTEKVDLYTTIETLPGKPNNRVLVWHELNGKRVGAEAEYPEHLSPYIVPTWNLADGEHYGRGLVEDYSGAFAKLSLLSEQLGLYELDALNILNLVDESAGGVIDDYQNADTGDYVPGKTGAVTAYERGDYNKIAAVRSSLVEVQQLLAQAFMYTGNVRDAERVTAEEIRMVAREAENTLGGVYSQLAESMQAPLAYLCMSEVSPGLLMGLVSKMYKPAIITGIPALTRSADTQSLLQATQELVAIAPLLQLLPQRIDINKVFELVMNSNSIDPNSISKSPEEIAALAQQQAAAADANMTESALLQNAEGIQDSLQGLL